MEDTVESDYKQGREVRRLYRCKQTLEMKDVLFRKVSDPSITIIQLLD